MQPLHGNPVLIIQPDRHRVFAPVWFPQPSIEEAERLEFLTRAARAVINPGPEGNPGEIPTWTRRGWREKQARGEPGEGWESRLESTPFLTGEQLQVYVFFVCCLVNPYILPRDRAT